MKRIVLGTIMAGFMLTAMAQEAKEEIMQNIALTGSNYLAYRGPQKQLTKAPKGYQPFYISHMDDMGRATSLVTQTTIGPFRHSKRQTASTNSHRWARTCCAE